MTVRRWLTGQNAVPKGVYADLETLVQDRSAVLHALAWSGRLFPARPGAGRPTSTDPARNSVKARLTDAQYAKWLELGSSKWIKRILDEYQSLLNQGAPARDEKK